MHREIAPSHLLVSLDFAISIQIAMFVLRYEYARARAEGNVHTLVHLDPPVRRLSARVFDLDRL